MLLSNSLNPGHLLSQYGAIIITGAKLETKTVPGGKVLGDLLQSIRNMLEVS